MPQAGTPKRQPSASPRFYSSHELREDVQTEVSVLLLTVLKVVAGSALCLWPSAPGPLTLAAGRHIRAVGTSSSSWPH